ncbi:MAG: methyltransferase domain-containing protein [Candidatus Krumholzibacteriota bacterium]
MNFFNKVSGAIAFRAFSFKKKLLRRLIVGPENRDLQALPAEPFNRTQELFIRWNAERLGITEEQSRRRYLHSWNVVSGGHRGAGFEIFMFLNQEIFSVFFGNSDDELFETYNFHGYRDLLRQMIFPEPEFGPDHPIVKGLDGLQEVSILDFGCGMAQRSRYLAEYLQGQGKKVRIHLADIPSIAEPFLVWMGENTDLDLEFLPCTKENPLPEIPECNVLVATEFFEHVSNPIEYFHRFDEKLQPGGFLWTDVADHEEGFLHVSPNLKKLRAELKDRGYRDIEPHVILQKD